MFCIGALLPPDEVRALFRQWPSVLFGTAVQYTTMPLLGWLATYLWGLEGDVRIGVLIVGCVPGAMASNVLTLAARGNVSYSVGLTTVATMLSPVVVPAALKLTAGASVPNAHLVRMGVDLVWMVVLPVLAGYAACRTRAGQKWLRRLCEPAANLAILWIIAAVVGRQRTFLQSAGATDLLGTLCIALAFINALGYLAGYAAGGLAGLDVRRRRALSIEVGMQNAGVGTQLAIALLGAASPATIPTALYTFGCMLTGTLLAQGFARWGQSVDDPAKSASDSGAVVRL
jgi:BASS family bile acid:Na+ symporter